MLKKRIVIPALLLILLFLIPGSIFCDVLSFSPSDRFKITEKYNLRKRVNGSYKSYVYRETSGNLLLQDNGNFSGNFYILEERTENTRTAQRLDNVVPVAFRLTPDGSYIISIDNGYPRLRGYPKLPFKDVDPGEKWRDYSEIIVDPKRNNVTTKVQIYCEYKYLGPAEYGGEEGYSIEAMYAVRYSHGDDPGGDPDLLKISGSHKVSIFLAETGTIFMRDNMDEEYRFRDGETISYTGFVLTWLGSFKPMDRNLLVKQLKETLTETQTEEVDVSPGAEGVSLTLQKIHFKPDEAVILPGEENRLDVIASVLKKIPDRTFLVVGHTADVGSYESQYILSVDRARAITDEFVRRGMEPGRFIYEGRAGTEPVAENTTEEGRSQNRRVEIIILED